MHGLYTSAADESVCRAGIEVPADPENGLVDTAGEGEGGTN